jgi:hypothetical protein
MLQDVAKAFLPDNCIAMYRWFQPCRLPNVQGSSRGYQCYGHISMVGATTQNSTSERMETKFQNSQARPELCDEKAERSHSVGDRGGWPKSVSFKSNASQRMTMTAEQSL